MKQIYQVLTGCLVAMTGLCSSAAAQLQPENSVWYFGNRAGVRFTANGPVAQFDGQSNSGEACASIATASGALALYSDGDRAWDASHQPMPNATALGGFDSASQSVLILPQPGNPTRYYLFTVDAIENNLMGGLRYSVVDMTLRGGLGDVLPNEKTIRLPTPTVTSKVTEKLTAALHANGRDYWVMVHGWENNEFYSFLLSPTGISPAPVTSAVGPVHAGGSSNFFSANAIGHMRVSPLGTHVALALRDSHFELYNFDKATGRVSNFIRLQGSNNRSYGVEFSPDNTLLYVGMYETFGYDSNVFQFNLRAGTTQTAIQNSMQTVMTVSGLAQGLRMGPDGKIYIAVLNQPYLHAIAQPNAVGTACGFTFNAVSLGSRLSRNCLPNTPNVYARSPLSASASTRLNRELKAYPNPASGNHEKVVVSVPVDLQKFPLQVELLNSVGQTVRHSTSAPQAEASVDVRHLTPGVYVVRLTGETGTACTRFTVQ